MSPLIPAWVDGQLRPVDKLLAHQKGWRHKAVSVFLFHNDTLLVQRRALEKYHTPGLWANTCCTHPHWNEPADQAAMRRIDEELNLSGIALSHMGQVEYRAAVGGGLIEHEVVDLFVGQCTVRPDLSPNPQEVCETAWLTRAALMDALAATPERYTPWLHIYMQEHSDQIWAQTATT